VLRTLQPAEREVSSFDGHWYLARLTPYRTVEDKIDGIVLTFVDITNRKHFEAQLESQTGELRQQAEVLNLAQFFIMDADHRIRHWNAGCEQLYGYTSAQAMGHNAHQLLKTEFQEPRSEIEAELENTGQWQGELVHTTKNGARTRVASKWILHRRNGEHAPVILEVNSDVTARWVAEEGLKEADRNKDRFIVTLAHELRNPLNALTSTTELLSRTVQDNPSANRAVRILSRQLGQLQRIVGDLLDVERLTRGRIALTRARCSLADVITTAVESCKSAIDEKNQLLEVAAPDKDHFLLADKTRLAQILSNLLDNASKYTPSGGKIELIMEKGPQTITFRVRDNGIGMAPEAISRVFNIYLHEHSLVRPEAQGLGIGLALVRQLAELHGGTVEARSEGLGKGSEFIVRIPMVWDETALPAATPHEPGDGKKKLKLLIVEDNSDSAEAMKMLLEADGHEVQTAREPKSALAIAPIFQPALAIIDIGLPGMDGYELAARLQKLVPATTLIALSGWRINPDDRRFKEAGFRFNFTKPLEPAQLEQVLATLARR
jgi:two-component system, chemotaxis family, CheB/CheR fusion protein